MQLNWYYFSTIALSILFCTSPSLAEKPPQPRFSANGYATDYAVGDMDLMIPINGDRYHNLYLNPAVAYGSDKQGYADLGFGYRWIQNCRTLLGVYLFGGYSRVEHNARLWVANPGIEAMGRRWDAHLNGYISMRDRNYHYIDNRDDLIGQIATGNRIASLRQIVNADQYTGNGLDVKLGYQLLPKAPLKGYIGGYYFYANEANSIGGGAVGLEYWVHPQIKTFASYTYDNVRHSTGALGLGIELGGTRQHRVNPCLEERITDPVERYLAELGRGSAIPNKSTYNYGVPFAGPETYVDNIAFFSSSGSSNLNLENCTAENPCGPAAFIQSNVDQLNVTLPNTNFYLSSGSYSATGTTIDLNPGQSIHSLTANYLNPASGTARANLLSNINLHGDNILENMLLIQQSDPDLSKSITIFGENNAIIGSQLGNMNPLDNILASNTPKVLISIKNTSATDPTSLILKDDVLQLNTVNLYDPRGIDLYNTLGNASVTLIDSIIEVASTNTNAGYGILMLNDNTTASLMDVQLYNTNVFGSHAVLHTFIGNPAAANQNFTVNGGVLSSAQYISYDLGDSINETFNGTTCIVSGTEVTCS